MGFSSNQRGPVYVSRGCSYTCMPTMLVCENSRVKYTTEQDLLRMNAYTCTCIYGGLNPVRGSSISSKSADYPCFPFA